jgi:LysM repeat protein
MMSFTHFFHVSMLKRTLSTALVLFLLLNIASCTRVKPIIRSTDSGIWHTIQPGEGLEQISRKYKVSRLKLQQINDIYDPSDLNPGMRIFVPRPQVLQSRKPIKKRSVSRKTARFLWPAGGTISSGYGIRHGRMHQGIDITKDGGKEIRAAGSGKVIFAGRKTGYGRTIIIDHGGGLSTLYAHNAKLYARKGSRVKQGAIISKMGASGASKGIHLHFEVRLRNKPQNPLRYLAIR